MAIFLNIKNILRGFSKAMKRQKCKKLCFLVSATGLEMYSIVFD